MKRSSIHRPLLLSALAVLTACGVCSAPGFALETGSGELAALQDFLLSRTDGTGTDYTGDDTVDGMDLAWLRQQAQQRLKKRANLT